MQHKNYAYSVSCGHFPSYLFVTSHAHVSEPYPPEYLKNK